MTPSSTVRKVSEYFRCMCTGEYEFTLSKYLREPASKYPLSSLSNQPFFSYESNIGHSKSAMIVLDCLIPTKDPEFALKDEGIRPFNHMVP